MSRTKDHEGDRLKEFERVSEVILDPSLPIILRLDGRSFSKWTHTCLDRPYDVRMPVLMERTMLRVAADLGARYAYCQSDEISLILLAEGKAEVPFSGRVQKLASVSASLAAAQFNGDLPMFGVNAKKAATFDCRVYSVPDRRTAADVILWREADAIRNSSLGRGQEFMSHKEMHGLSAKEVRQELLKLGKGWGELPPERKFGTAYARRTVRRRFGPSEIEKLPAKHAARKDPSLVVERQDYVKITELPLRWNALNPVEVIFESAAVELKQRRGSEADEVLT